MRNLAVIALCVSVAACGSNAQLASPSHEDSRAAASRAVDRYAASTRTLIAGLGELIDKGSSLRYFDHTEGRQLWISFLGDLEAIDSDLAIAERDPAFALELCVACIDADWNMNGQIDDRDRHMLELEYDATGAELPEGDPRRRPRYRFDAGDIEWARAMVSFQRAAVEIVLAYRWSELDGLLGRWDRPMTVHLVDRGRVRKARELLLQGLRFSATERAAYLAETDDDREWVPNPRQKSYAMPLTVDDDLYATWAALLRDLDALVAGREGISLRDAAALVLDPEDAATMPDAYVDIGRMLSEPGDIVLDFSRHASDAAALADFLRGVLGHGYATSMRASPLVGRLRHMKDALVRGDDTLDRKLRYLFWLN